MFKDIYLSSTSHRNSIFPVCLCHLCYYHMLSPRILWGLCIERINHAMWISTVTPVIPAVPVLLLVQLIPWTAGPLWCQDVGLILRGSERWAGLLCVCCPVRAKGTKYSTWQGISTDYGHNRGLKLLSFSDLMWPVVKSLWSVYRRSWVMSPSVLREASVGVLSRSVHLWQL